MRGALRPVRRDPAPGLAVALLAAGLALGTGLGALRPEGPAFPARPPAPPAAVPAAPAPAARLELDLNTADEAVLAGLPGVGPVLAGRIVAHRTAQGPFRRVEDLRAVPGIGAGRWARLRPLVRVAP